MILTLVAACWSPAPYTPPPPAQVEASDVLEGTADTIRPPGDPGADDAPEATPPEAAGEPPDDPADAAADPDPDAADPDPGEPDADAAADPPPAPTDLPVDPYAAHTVGRPVTLVGDDGVPLVVLTTENVAVTVLAEGPERLKVRCTGCTPQVEGWLQRRVVAR